VITVHEMPVSDLCAQAPACLEMFADECKIEAGRLVPKRATLIHALEKAYRCGWVQSEHARKRNLPLDGGDAGEPVSWPVGEPPALPQWGTGRDVERLDESTLLWTPGMPRSSRASPLPDRGDDPADIVWARDFIGRVEGMYEEWAGEGPAPSLSVDYENLTRRLRQPSRRLAPTSTGHAACDGRGCRTCRPQIPLPLGPIGEDEPPIVDYARAAASRMALGAGPTTPQLTADVDTVAAALDDLERRCRASVVDSECMKSENDPRTPEPPLCPHGKRSYCGPCEALIDANMAAERADLLRLRAGMRQIAHCRNPNPCETCMAIALDAVDPRPASTPTRFVTTAPESYCPWCLDGKNKHLPRDRNTRPPEILGSGLGEVESITLGGRLFRAVDDELLDQAEVNGVKFERKGGRCGGDWTVAGTRMTIRNFVAYANTGRSVASIHDAYPRYTAEQIIASLLVPEEIGPKRWMAGA